MSVTSFIQKNSTYIDDEVCHHKQQGSSLRGIQYSQQLLHFQTSFEEWCEEQEQNGVKINNERAQTEHRHLSFVIGKASVTQNVKDSQHLTELVIT